MNNNYQIFLIDGGEFAELDCEDLDMVTTFSITDISDLSAKNDNISQNVKFKNTKNNSQIFGNLSSSSRLVSSSSKLGTGFSINRKVECVVFEDNVQILKGFLKINNQVNNNGDVEYQGIISGNIFNFYSLLQDKELSDLSFSGFTHTYNLSSIIGSWGTPSGNGYMYPLINYGDKSSPISTDINKIHINNFRCSIYLNQYLTSIFQQPSLSGFTYTINGSQDFKNEINGLIIPDNSDTFNQTNTGTSLTLTNSGTITPSFGQVGTGLSRVVNFPSILDYQGLIQPNTSNFLSQTSNLFTWKRDVNGDVKFTSSVYIENKNSNSISCYFRLMERDSTNTANNLNEFNVIEEYFINTVNGNSNISKSVSFIVPQRLYQEKKQFIIVFYAQGSGVSYTSDNFIYNFTNSTLIAPSVSTNKLTYSVMAGDTVTPQPVSGVKQKDFIKSFCLLYNLYTYSSLDNSKHIIFETYNDYYSKAKVNFIAQNAIDWTYKVDHSSDLTISSFNDTSKKYSFTFKADSDYWNNLYSSKYGEIYGQYTEKDSTGNGINDEKKLELVFSPTPMVNYSNTNRFNPEIFKLNGDNSRSTTKSNIRILHYNGQKSCTPYEIGTMNVSGTTYTFTPIIEVPFSSTFNTYPQTGHLKLQSGLDNFNYLSDLNFGKAKEYFFLVKPQIETIGNQYTNYYRDQILELSDLNITLFDCEALLTPIDISNLDLKTPVFIQSADGNSYYKVLKVDYHNQYETSSVQLQKIII